MRKASFVTPFYNEESVLKKTPEKIYEYIRRNFSNFEIIFVDVGSSDSSLEVINEFIKNHKHVKVISYKKNQGRGEAIRQGFLNANGQIIGYFDCDLEIKLKYLKDAVQKLDEFDVVIASKFAEGAIVDTPKMRKVSSYLYNAMVKLILGSRVSDHQAGFKFFRKKVIDSILKKNTRKR